jgi:hypothetical protein
MHFTAARWKDWRNNKTKEVKSMKSLSNLMQEIIQLTSEIETRYPELYNYLDETPLSFCETKEKTISTDDLKEYLETLKSQLHHHIETRKSMPGKSFK